jgi:signal transduction histidine kinase
MDILRRRETEPPELDRAWVPGRILRWTGLAVVVLVAVGAWTSDPPPSLEGRGLGVLVSLIVFGGSCLAARALHIRCHGRAAFAMIVLWLVGALTLVGFQPDGPGWLGVFTAVGAVVMNAPARYAAWLYGITCVALGIGLGLAGTPPYAIALTEFGVAVFVILSLMVVRLRESYREQRRLIEELEETRDAQAQAAAFRERGRLAREMHDVLAHSLSGLLLQLEGARLLASRNGADSEVGAAIDRAHHLAKAGLDEARRAIGMLRDEELPGPERLPALAAEFERDAGVPVSVDVHGQPLDLGSEAKLALFRTAQEALTNVRKHAHAERVDVHLSYEPDGARLVVEDVATAPNGDGPLAGTGSGYGLAGMRERAELIGGKLVAAATPQGFRVELWVPA